MNKKFIIAVITICMSALCISATAQAHVLVTDNSGQIGAILHVMPDDDPIAGESSALFFDVQTDTISKAKLSITDSQNKTVIVQNRIVGSTVSATYIFPRQGAYTITLAVLTGASPYTFSSVQRVSRGVSDNAADKSSYAWAELLLIVNASGLVVLGIFAYNNRKNIALHSKR